MFLKLQNLLTLIRKIVTGNKSAVTREYVFPLLPTYNKRVGIFRENFHKKVVKRVIDFSAIN